MMTTARIGGTPVDIGDTVQGFVMSVLRDEIKGRSLPAIISGVVVTVGLVGAAISVGGVLGWGVFGLFAVLAAAITIATVVLRWVVVRWLNRQIGTVGLADHQDALSDAVDEMDLPDGALSSLRFAWRLRNGHEAEAARMKRVLEGLHARVSGQDDATP